MNLKVLPTLIATGVDQAVEVERGYCLAIHANADAELRDAINGDKYVIPADVHVTLGVSLGQTIYLRAAVGTTIELALV